LLQLADAKMLYKLVQRAAWKICGIELLETRRAAGGKTVKKIEKTKKKNGKYPLI